MTALILLSSTILGIILLAHRRWPGLLPLSVVWTAAALPAGAIAASLVGRRPPIVFGTLFGSMMLFAWLACGWSLPALETVRVIPAVGRRLREVRDGEVLAYKFLEPGLLFYARRRIDKLETPGQLAKRTRNGGRFAILAREEEIAEVRAAVGVPLRILDLRRGFCEDSGPLGLAILSR